MYNMRRESSIFTSLVSLYGLLYKTIKQTSTDYMAYMINCNHKNWDMFTKPFPNFNVMARIGKYILQKMCDVCDDP